MLATLSQDLGLPEYLHVLLNPLPVYGLAMGVIGLISALILRSRAAQVSTLTIILICSAMTWPVAHYGNEGYDRAFSIADDVGDRWLKVHAQRANEFIPFYYALAVLAAAAIVLPRRWPKAGTKLALLTLVLAFVLLAMGGYIAYAGGRIRHREFRNEPPPPLPAGDNED